MILNSQVNALYELVTQVNADQFTRMLTVSGWSTLPPEVQREVCRLRKIHKAFVMTPNRRERIMLRLVRTLSVYSTPPPLLVLPDSHEDEIAIEEAVMTTATEADKEIDEAISLGRLVLNTPGFDIEISDEDDGVSLDEEIQRDGEFFFGGIH